MNELIREFRRRMDWSQAELAKAMNLDQTRVSRLEGGSAGVKFKELCDHLRKLARKYPRQWLELLADFDTGDTYRDFADLFFITENVSVVDFSELWVISEQPAECTRVSMRQRISERLKADNNASIVYWVPEHALDLMRLLARNFQADGVDRAQLSHVRVVRTPANLTLMPVGLIDPRSDNTIGVLSPQLPSGGGIRVVVLPKATSKHVCSILEPCLAELEDRDGNYRDERLWPGFEWKMWQIADLRSAINDVPMVKVKRRR